jgi:alanine racemase
MLRYYLEVSPGLATLPLIHLKLETGMHRLGFSEAELGPALALLTAQSRVKVASVFSHLAASDDAGKDTFTHHQFAVFEGLSQKVSDALGYMPTRHILNSAGIARFAQKQYDMVRLGIGLYGVDASGLISANLRPISTLRTVVLQVQAVQKGEGVGYDVGFTAPAPMRIATIGIGYADGYRRSLGHGVGQVLIRGHRAATVGNICMDMTMVDVTGIDCHPGDEVEVFGSGITVQELARWEQTTAYEVISTISARVKRVYLEE